MNSSEKVRIVSNPPSSKEIILIAGFPGSGLVGSIAVRYLIDKLGFKLIGNITAADLPVTSIAQDGLAKAPIGIYENDGVVAVTSEVPIPDSISCYLASGLIGWLSQSCNISDIVVIGGVVTGGEGERVFGVSTTREGLEKIKSACLTLPAINIAGIIGSFLTEGILRNISAHGFLVETNFDIDPRASAAGLEVISKLYNIDTDVSELVEQADAIEPMLKQMADGVKNSEIRPISLNEDMMYG